MSTEATCFENIIGLSRTPCECVDDAPVGADVSESGLYLDELPGLSLNLVDQARKCGQGSIWDMMEQAVENAIEDTKAELGACISANTDPRRQNGTSQIGEDKRATRTGHNLTRAYHGMTLQTAKVKGGYFVVTHIATAFKADSLPASIDVSVYERESISSDPLTTITLPCTANKVVWTALPTPLELSMSELGTDNPRFWFLYEPVDGMKAMNSEINCSCGGFAPYWDQNRPQYASSQQKQGKLWAEWSMAGGTFGNTLEDREDWTVENPTQGLLLRVQFICDETSSFCSDTPDYRRDPFQKVIAHTVRVKAGANLLQDILMSTNINRYTMTAGDQLEELKKAYEADFLKRIAEYLCPELSNETNVNRYGDCRRCKDRWGMRRGTILS